MLPTRNLKGWNLKGTLGASMLLQNRTVISFVVILVGISVFPLGEHTPPSLRTPISAIPALPEGYGFCPVAYCEFDLFFENHAREVAGTITEECDCKFDCGNTDDCHSCGLGNWGVASDVDGVQDGSQFEGWIATQAHSGEWNSCTLTCSSGSSCFNNGDGSQVSSSVQWYANWSGLELEVAPETGCGELDGSWLTRDNHWMDIQELDAVNHDTITVLTFANPDVTLQLDCDPDELESCATFDPGPWTAPSDPGDGRADTEVRLVLQSVSCNGCTGG